MKKTLKTTLLVLVSLVVLNVISGCNQQTATGSKKDKLLTAENIQLKNELQQKDKQINKLKKQLVKANTPKKPSPPMPEDISKRMMEDIGRLGKENAELKAKLEELNKTKTCSEPNSCGSCPKK